MECWGDANKSKGAATIPDKISSEGLSDKVTHLVANAFTTCAGTSEG